MGQVVKGGTTTTTINNCPPTETIIKPSTSFKGSFLNTFSFTGPIQLSKDINYEIYHKVDEATETLHLILKYSDSIDRWLGFGFAEQGSGHMKGTVYRNMEF